MAVHTLDAERPSIDPANAADDGDDVEIEVVGDRFDPRGHFGMLLMCATVVVLSVFLVVTPEDRVAPRFVAGWTLPESCATHRYLGVDCPGCGLTRSFVHLAAFRPVASFASHPLGWLVAAFLVAQFPYRWLALRQRDHHPFGRTWPVVLTRGLIALLLVVWVVRLVV